MLDLFAGTGALGLEALSRGAAFALFVDDGAEARALIRDNVEALGLGGATRIFRRDATKLGAAHPVEPFSLAFLDPPYGRGLAEQALGSARAGGWLAPDALVVVEEAATAGFAAPEGFDELERRVYDDTELILLRRADDVRAELPHHSALTPAALIGGPHLSSSLSTSLARKSELRSFGGGTNRPRSSMRLRTAGVSSASTVAALTRRMIAAGVSLGKKKPFQPSASTSARPCSSAVGRLGSTAERALDMIAIALHRPGANLRQRGRDHVAHEVDAARHQVLHRGSGAAIGHVGDARRPSWR